MQKQLNKQKLKSELKKLSSGKVLVIGDIILDEFITGSPERISREAPVIILEHLSSTFAMGGASNAAHNISAIGAECFLIGVTGNDLYSKAITNECNKIQIKTSFIIDEERPTTVKTRILSISHKHPTSNIQFKQQILRLDRLTRKKINQKIENELMSVVNENIKKTNVVLISDYELGVCTERLITQIIKTAKKYNKPVIADASKNFQRFKGAFLITPNQPDTEEVAGFQIVNNETLIKAGKKLLKISGAENILITRGSEGMTLFSTSNTDKPLILPAFNVSEVFDVTGAGDTVAGVVACGISVKLPKESACIIGNLAASLVVQKYGTAVTNIKELTESLNHI